MINRKTMRARAAEAIDKLRIKIPGIGDTMVRRMSGGQRQGVAIARSIMWGRRVLLLDEPTAGLGVKQQDDVERLIHGLQQHELPMMIIAHDMPLVFRLAQRIVVLRHGRVVADMPTADTTPQTVVAFITGAAQARETLADARRRQVGGAAAMTGLVAGVDCSTQTTKVVVVDAESGRAVASGRCANTVLRRGPSSESDPRNWWDALRAAIAETGCGAKIAALSIAAQQLGLVTLDGDHRPLRRAEPETAAATRHIRLPHDYLTERLTGQGVTDRGDASGTGWWSGRRETYVEEVLALPEVALDERLLPRVLAHDAPAGGSCNLKSENWLHGGGAVAAQCPARPRRHPRHRSRDHAAGGAARRLRGCGLFAGAVDRRLARALLRHRSGGVDPAALIILVGGSSKGRIWQQTIARPSGRPLLVPEAEELVAWGAATQTAAALTGEAPIDVARRWNVSAGRTIDRVPTDREAIERIERVRDAALEVNRRALFGDTTDAGDRDQP